MILNNLRALSRSFTPSLCFMSNTDDMLMASARELQQPESPIAVVAALHICPGHRKPMTSMQAIEAITKVGLNGHRYAVCESARQVLLMDSETLDQLGLAPGTIRENIATAGLVFASLKRGTRLSLGEVILQVSGPCSPCASMEEIRPGLQEDLRGRRRMLARVLCGGTLRVGDSHHIMDSHA